ncbi:hypothetical protein [Caulobacter sp. 17J80-11]|uniref:hypothetical protein n=1 Tax=Caulobacter sp. 17J80-11 TaxID=2763502 RepID=UPI001653A68B|nr:hypothetical protein [Caulobacter sp. 17J80-11]MBC6982959.1 hypothetical protein [Caulobacter sp. 17J80-11]
MRDVDRLTPLKMDQACLEELIDLYQANWTGDRLESVFRLRALADLSTLPTETLLQLAAERPKS